MTLGAHGAELEMGLEHRDHISDRIRQNADFYERDLLDDVYKRAPKGTAIDVGAHIGNHTLWFTGVCGLRTIALEPNLNSYLRLSANIDRNHLDARALNMAAGRDLGRCNVEPLREGNSGMSRVVYDDEGEIRVTPVDKLGARDVSVLKIDTEGAELDVLFGAVATLKYDRPLVYVETTDNQEAVDAFLKAFGYECFGAFCKTPTFGYAA